MSEIRYAILSDLHFGATNSVLTSLSADASEPAGFGAHPSQPSPLVDAVLTALGQLTEKQEKPPTLVLAGDILDLALSPDEVAATAFEGFVDRAFGTGRPVFGPVVYYLPGNHDHHLWEGTREVTYTTKIRQLPPSEPIPPPRHTTHLRPGEVVPCEGDLISALIQRRPGCDQIEVRMAYPNLALVSDSGSQAQVISHGHFTESIYTLMSRLRRILFPDQSDTGELIDVETLESENFAWIDFFWSTLGRSGEVGIDVARIYADLQSAANLDKLVSNLAVAITAQPHNAPWLRRAESALLAAVLRREVHHIARAERATPEVALSDAGRAGVRSYLEGAVLTQLQSQMGGVPGQLGFVFGHTHKPFVERWQVGGYPNPLTIANTGGWVVDTAAAAPCQGGAVVLIDDDLDAAVVQLYRQESSGVAPVKVLPISNSSGVPSALTALLTDVIDPAAKPWASVSAAAAPLVAERRLLQENLSKVATERIQRRTR